MNDSSSGAAVLDSMVVAVELPGLPASVARARVHAAATLDVWGVEGDAAETAVLVVSELVTNGVIHGCRYQATPIFNTLVDRPNLTLRLTFRMTHHSARLLIEVFDPSLDPPHRVEASADDEAGRGLRLLDELTERWDFRVLSFGKVVWCEVGV